ncbi:MAG: type II toxin-antitoxin system PrlF family antitoxin [Chloroflexota bacterium]|nr:type II toxin-antitoxin system PrlF family antitoxin [Chloroflexota bacterium]
MQEIVSTITSRGQVTIPAAVRRHLGVGQHDKIVFVLEDDGEVRLSVPRYPTIDSLRGIAGSLPRPMSWQEIEEIAQDEHAEDVASSL